MLDEKRPTDAGYGRILVVLEAIARHGPVKLDPLVDLTGIPRTPVFRCLKELEAQGYIRPRLGDGAYLLVAEKQGLLAEAPSLGEEVDILAPQLIALSRQEKVDCEVGVLMGMADYSLIERTKREDDDADRPPFLSDPAALTALLVEPPARRVRHVKAAMDRAAPGDRDEVTSGRYTSRLAAASKLGHVEAFDAGALYLPIHGARGFVGAIRIEDRRQSRNTPRRLLRVADILRRRCPDLIPGPDQIRERYWSRAAFADGAGRP